MRDAEPAHATSRSTYNDSPCTVASMRVSPVPVRRPSQLVSEMLPLSPHTAMATSTSSGAAADVDTYAGASAMMVSRLSGSGNWSMLGGIGVTESGVSGSNGSSGFSAPQLRSDSMSNTPLHEAIADIMDW
jgi:hypothetical protein